MGAAIGLLFKGPNRILAYLLAFSSSLMLYYPLTKLGEGVAENGNLPPWLSLEFGNLAIWMASFVLFRRASR